MPARAGHRGDTETRFGASAESEKPYRSITIAQFRDMFVEDVIDNPDKRDDVERYGLVARSKSWFRELFRREGWRSPAQKPERAHGGRVSHPLRDPMPRRGMLVQVDGTPYDWFGNGDARVLHLAVDDATTEVLSGCFMPLECMRGYARMAERMVRGSGVPEAVCSDKHSVFRSTKAGTETQLAMMLSDLGVRMVFANSPQAKGRVERYNLTEQLRLVNDIIRFGIEDYDQLDSWFNEFYVEYLNKKFSFPPAEAGSEFRRLPPGFDYSSVFRIRLTRVSRGGMISYEMGLYWMVERKRRALRPGRGRQGQPVHRRMDRRDVRRALRQALRMRPLRGAGAQESRARRQPEGSAGPVEEDAQMTPTRLRGGDIIKKLQQRAGSAQKVSH